MAKYRKKPITIEATQWFKNGDHPLDYSRPHDGLENGEPRQFSPEERKANNWEGDIVRHYRHPDVPGEAACKHCSKTMHEHGWIDTLEGGHVVCPGDWIITGVQGERYPCEPDVFKATYEPAVQGVSGVSGLVEPEAWVAADTVDGQVVNGKPRRIWWENNEGVGTPIYTAPQPAPGVAGLVEALKACRNELMWMIEKHNQQNQNDSSWLYDYQTVAEADVTLAAYHKQGGEL